MELRPRKGRSTPAPSTPCSVSRPASRSSSSSRKKQEPVTPILVLSDNDGDQHDERKETGISDMTLPASNPGYSTPLSSVAKSHRARTSTRKSNAKQRVKVMSPVTANLEKSEDKSVTSQDVDGETCTEGLSLERTACMKNVPENAVSEVLSENLVVSTSSKKPHSTRKKQKDRGKFSDNKQDGVGIHERIDDRSKQNRDQERFIDDHDEGQGMLSLVLSEEETAEVSDSVNMGRIAASITKASSDSEAEPVHTEVSGGSIKRRNPSIEEVAHEEALGHSKIFEGKTGIARSTALNVESEAYSKLETKGVLILREEAYRPSEGNAQEDVEERIRNFGGHEGTSLNEGFSKSKVSDSDLVACDEAKFGVTGATVTRDENEQRNVRETSLIALNEVSNAISGHKGNRDNSTRGFGSDVTKDTVMLTDEGENLEDDEGSSSSGNDEGDDEDELASVLVKSMKLHLLESCYGLNKQQEYQAKEGEVFRAETVIQKAAARGINGKDKSLGHGLSWSPDTGLPTSITSPTLTGKAKGIQNGVPEKIWRKDGCLQDGLLVPPVDPHKLNKLARKRKRDTKGEKWFNMCAPTITPELQKELQLVKLRGVLDPKRHYKAEDTKGLPKYFQVGTVVGGPADFYSGRLTKKEQKCSLADELLSNSSLTAYRKRKYLEIQDQKQAGGKGFWKQKKSKRTPAWAKI